MAHGYETGRLNLPFVGISTFGKSPYQPDWNAINADVAILGAPYDAGTNGGRVPGLAQKPYVTRPCCFHSDMVALTTMKTM